MAVTLVPSMCSTSTSLLQIHSPQFQSRRKTNAAERRGLGLRASLTSPPQSSNWFETRPTFALEQQCPQNETSSLSRTASKICSIALTFAIATSGVEPALARYEGVNKPELLPEEFTTVIDIAGFLSAGQEARLKRDIARIEQDTGFKLRILAQNYPETPGLAIRDYWNVDDETIVFVADPNLGNILNFNVGAAVDLSVPRSFWSRLAGKYGNLFYWREKGEDAAMESAVIAIDACLREPVGPRQCATIQ